MAEHRIIHTVAYMNRTLFGVLSNLKTPDAIFRARLTSAHARPQNKKLTIIQDTKKQHNSL